MAIRTHPLKSLDATAFPRIAAVMRAATILIMTLALLWQGMAFARVGLSIESLADAEHAALHMQQEGHHHHGDSYHVDDSAESASHLALDHTGAPALSPDERVAVHVPSSSTVRTLEVRAGPYPFLEGPLRPPRLTA